jgi:carbamoyltransferase
MWTLGICGTFTSQEEEVSNPMMGEWGFHDAAAALLHDGRIVAAVEEERLNRIKHCNFFPDRAIAYCLREAGISLSAVDRIAVPMTETDADVALGQEFQGRLTSGRRIVTDAFAARFGLDVSDQLHFCKHHLAHLWTAFVPSGFDRALVVSLDGAGFDGAGGFESVLAGVGGAGGLELLVSHDDAKSLGFFYQRTIGFLGYTRFDEYKVMGLAPYGDPEVYRSLFRDLYELRPGGDYGIAGWSDFVARLAAAGLLDAARRKGAPFTQLHMDFAAALQESLETIAFHLLSHLRTLSGEPNLCLAGGVAHNCTLNGKLLYSGMFDELYVQPVAHDAGLALGAAYDAHFRAPGPVARPPLETLFLGPPLAEDGLERELDRWRELIDVERRPEIEAETARLLAQGSVVGWVQGRSEFGPRALGNRSILADPRPAENKGRINQMVKKREAYRPFAPSVLEESLHAFFDVPASARRFPFMIFVLRVRESMRLRLGAITHVDGTARVQTVSREDNRRYWELIREFGALTGVPMLLNTSFNNHAEPIVDSVDDAVVCFLTTDITHLVVGDYLVRKREVDLAAVATDRLAISLLPHQKLVARQPTRGGEEPRYAIESTAGRYFARGAAISASMFRVLTRATGPDTLAGHCRALGIAVDPPLTAELLRLWQERSVTLRPVG